MNHTTHFKSKIRLQHQNLHDRVHTLSLTPLALFLFIFLSFFSLSPYHFSSSSLLENKEERRGGFGPRPLHLPVVENRHRAPQARSSSMPHPLLFFVVFSLLSLISLSFLHCPLPRSKSRPPSTSPRCMQDLLWCMQDLRWCMQCVSWCMQVFLDACKTM